jgi:hypothetical protein
MVIKINAYAYYIHTAATLFRFMQYALYAYAGDSERRR